MGQWSGLPADLLTMIHEHLHLYPDKIRFSCVCTNWQSGSSPAGLPDLRQPQPPWLLLPYENGSLCRLYHPREKKVYEIDLPEIGDKVLVGSGHGWVVTVELDGSINVVNPLSRIRLPLPPRYTFPDGRSHVTIKVALSCSPSYGDFMAVALYSGMRLAYCKFGDEEWLDLLDFGDKLGCYWDIAFLDGKLYALNNRRELMICEDIASNCPKLRKCVHGEEHYPYFKHLVNSSRGVMVVETHYNSVEYLKGEGHEGSGYVEPEEGEHCLNLCKIDVSSSSCIQVECLDVEILFIRLGTQLGVSSEQFRGSKGNRIYFANRIRHVDDGFDNQHLEYECNVPKICWVMPNPY